MRLPDVIGIGTRRCGSSWLHYVLNKHPLIGKPPNGLHFFSSEFERGISWYAGQLAPFAEHQILLEFSVSYVYPEYAEIAAQRIVETIPDAKLFVCLRNPVERTWSDFLRSIRNAELPKDISFEAAMEREPMLVQRSRYGQLLGPYFKRYGAERIKVLFYEDLRRDRIAYVSDLLKFLGLNPAVQPEWVERTEPTGKGVRFAWINSAILGTKVSLDKTADWIGLGDTWSNWKAGHVESYEKLLELNFQEMVMSSATEDRLYRLFADDIRDLSTMTGRNLEHWCRPEGQHKPQPAQADWAPRAWFEAQASSIGASDVADNFGHAENGYQRYRHARLERALTSIENELGRGSMLDVGCGSGVLTARIARRFAIKKAVGIDFVESVLEQGRHLYPEIEFRSGTLPTLAFEDSAFDLVIASEVLYYLTPAARRSAMNEILRVLVPGGHVLITAGLGGPYMSLGEVHELAGHQLQIEVEQTTHMAYYHYLSKPFFLASRLHPMLKGSLRPASEEMRTKLERWRWLLGNPMARLFIAGISRIGRPILGSERLPRWMDRLGLGKPTNMIVIGRRTKVTARHGE